MARINTQRLAQQAISGVYRGDQVRRDPAVRKAARRASDDLEQALRSSIEFVQEARASWQRSR